MAIQFVNNVDFNFNQAQEFVLENLALDPTAGNIGRLIYNTASNKVKVDNGTAFVDISGDITEVAAGTYLNGGGTTGVVTLNHDLTSRSDTTSSSSPGYGGSFAVVDSVTSNSTGHITAINVKTVALPAAENYSFDVSDGSNTETINSGDTVTWSGTGTTTVSYSTGSNTFTINSADQYQGTVTSVSAGNSTFITGSGGPITSSGFLIYSLSATGTPSSSTYLRGDNTWSALPGPPTISLTGEVTGVGTTSISTTVANNVLDVANFNNSAIVIESEGIENNDNDTTLPTSAAVKAYVDASTVGGLVYQGGYDAATNTPNLDNNPVPNNIKKGWTYTVTVDGTFFTEQVRVGDVLIAEVDAPTALSDWTTVQNNIDLASLTQVGIGNVNAGAGITVTYSNGTATVSKDKTNQSAQRISLNSAIPGISRAEAGGITTFTLDISSSTFFDTGAVALDVMVEVVGDSVNAGETVYAEIGRSGANMTIKFTGSVASGAYQVLLNYVA